MLVGSVDYKYSNSITGVDGSINDVVSQTDNSTIQVPSTLPIKDKLYTVIDTENNVIRIYSCDNQYNTIPLCGLPIWED